MSKDKAVYESKDGKLYVKKKKGITRHEENKVQKPIVNVLAQLEQYTGELTFFHVPNQLLRRSKMRKIYSGLGVRAGVPDMVVPLRGGRTLFIELKYKKNSTSKNQDIYIDKLRELDHIVEIIDSDSASDSVNQLYDILEKYNVEGFSR